MAAFENGLRSTRTIQTVFLFTAFLYPATAEYLHPQAKSVDAAIFYGVLIVAATDVVVAVLLRRAWLGPAEEALRANAEDGAALLRWRQAQIVPLVLAETVCLFGFVLRFIGAPLARAVPFYGAAIILIVLFRPTDPRS